MNKDIIQLLIKKHGEGLTPEEEASVGEWRESSGKNNEFYRLSEGLLQAGEANETAPASAWQLLQQKIKQDEEQRKKRRRLRYVWGSVAACLCLTFGLVFALSSSWKNVPGEEYIVSTAYGESKSFQLPDGSLVTIAGGTEVKYPQRFEGANRRIELEGEAFFDVKKGKGEFTVVTGNVRTVVKGTRFNVKAYREDERVETVLIDGKVSFLFQQQEIELKPEEKVVYHISTGTVEKSTVIYPNCCIDDEFRIENQRLEEVMTYLKRLYNIDVEYEDTGLKELHYSGVIRKQNSLNHTLEVITGALHIESTQTGQTVVLQKGK